MSEAKRPLLTSYKDIVCEGSEPARKERFQELAGELKEQVDVHKTVSRVSDPSYPHYCRPLLCNPSKPLVCKLFLRSRNPETALTDDNNRISLQDVITI